MTSPVLGLDHLRVSVSDLSAAAADYRLLLGHGARPPDEEAPAAPKAFAATSALLPGGNLDLLLHESSAPRGLEAIAFRVDDIGRMRRRLQRLGIASEGVEVPGARAAREALRVRARTLELLFVQREADVQKADSPGVHAVTGLDHLVIRSADAPGTAFLLGSQLGLDLRMDMSRPEWGARFLFFRCGDSIVEVVESLNGDNGGNSGDAGNSGNGGEDDALYGLSWRVADIDAAYAQLCAQGFDVSPVRSGRRPGTRVLTVRDRTAGVATLLLQPPA